jgi:hypothetical protein
MQLAARLPQLKHGSGYNSDLSATRFDQKLLWKKSRIEQDSEISSRILAALPFDSRLHRDIRIDYGNPREELPKYTKYVDEIPPFDQPAISMMIPYDDQAIQQVDLVRAGRSNYAFEENKYNEPLAMDLLRDELRTREFNPYAAAGKQAKMDIQEQLKHAEEMETTSVL